MPMSVQQACMGVCSAWLAQRRDDPAFTEHFGWFGTPAYWQEQVRILHDQIEAMQEAPLML